MAVTANHPGKLTLGLWQALRASNPVKCMLTDGTWAMDVDTDQYVSAVSGEVSGTGYTAGGQSLSNVSETYDASSDTMLVNADPASWDATGGELSAAQAVFYVDTGSASTSPVVSVWDLGGEQTATNAPFTLTIAGNGLVRIG